MGRKPKYTTNELKNILFKYDEETEYIEKVNCTYLADYAKEKLGYKDIRYYHFSRNKEISKLIDEYNESMEAQTITSSKVDNVFVHMNIKDFVKQYHNNPKELTFMLSKIQECEKRIYDRMIDGEIEHSKLREEFNKVKELNNKYKKQNTELRKIVKELKIELEVHREVLNIKQENQLLKALDSIRLVEVEFNKENEEDSEKDKIDKYNEKNAMMIETILNEYSSILDD